MPLICLITEGLISFEQKGGVATWIRELIRSLPDYSFSWLNFSSNSDHSLQTGSIKNLVSTKSIHISSYPLEIENLSSIMEENLMPECDLYHATSTGCASLLGISMSQKNRTPFILTEHAIYWKELQDTHELECGLTLPEDYAASFRNIARTAYQLADYITSPVNYVRNLQIEEGADPEKCKVVPNGLSLLQDYAKKRKTSFCLGFVGRITRIKNLELWIEIAREIFSIRPDIQYKIIGPLEDMHYGIRLHQLVTEKGLENNLTFISAIDHKDWREDLDALLLTSHMESQPYVILEAFSSRIPVFARDVGGISETIGSSGYLFSTDEKPNSIAGHILSIIQDSSSMEEYRKKEWYFFQNRYHISYMKKEFDQIYQIELRKNAKK